ncbi:MAG: tetratricopeptide repeat protein [Nitrospinae bacterium]|nr:tetratricopeptide repeat protein [Nitrospinota bacterium]
MKPYWTKRACCFLLAAWVCLPSLALAGQTPGGESPRPPLQGGGDFIKGEENVPLLAKGGEGRFPEDLFRQAAELDKQGFLDEAVPAWKKALDSRLDPKSAVVARARLSIAHFKLGQFDAAAEQALSLARSEPENFDANFNLGNIMDGLNRYAEAVPAFQKAVQLRPGEGLAYVGLALSHFGAGQPEQALAELQKVKELFKEKKNISWHRDASLMALQMKNFVQAQYPPSFSDLWLKNNLKVIRETYEKTLLNP